jgi:putative ABC transport system permease protein
MMAPLESFRFALAALRANRLRSALTTLGIVIGVAAVILVVSLVQGLEHSVLKEVEQAGSQTLFVRPLLLDDVPLEEFTKVRDRDLTREDLKALGKALPEVVQVTPLGFTATDLRAEGYSAHLPMVMTDDSYIEGNGLVLQAGRNFVPADGRLGSKVLILGSKAAEKLGLKGNPIGRRVATPTQSLEVIGVLAERGASLGNDPDSEVLVPLTTGLPLLTEEQRRQLFFQVRLDARISADDGAERVTEALRRIRGYRPGQPDGFKVFSQKQIGAMVGKITRIIGLVAAGMVSIALLVGGIGIMNIMLVSVTERTREIGIRKAIGAKRRDVLTQFLVEAALLSVLGGGAGLALGCLSGAVLGRVLFGAAGAVPVWALLCAVGIPAAIGVLFGLYPAWSAARLSPMESLKFE